MDPLTHGLLGGVTAQALFRKKVNLAITTAGMLGGMAPDLDILIQSKTNPLLMFEYHRNFTHSLAFIPLGGAFVGFLLWLLWRRKPPLKTMLLAAIAGYATHGLLDACTSYGTMLYWPFSRERISWDWIFILDPFYTFPLLVGLWISLRRKQGNAALSALVLTSLYLGVGVFQHHRALSYQQALAEQRGQSLQKGRVIPMLGPFLIWRSIEITGEQVQVEALRVGYSGAKKNWGRSSLPHFNSSSVPIPAESILGRDMQIFEWFSDAYTGILNVQPLEVGDLRFAVLPDSTQALWGIRIDPLHPEKHVQRLRFRFTVTDRLKMYFHLLLSLAPARTNFSIQASAARMPSTAALVIPPA